MTYEQEVAILADKTDYSFPFLMDSHGKKVYVLLRHDAGIHGKKMCNVIFDRLRCEACRSRIKKLCRYTNTTGQALCFTPSKKALLMNPSFYDAFFALQEEIAIAPIVGLKILTERSMDGYEEKEGGFSHYHIDVGEERKSECDTTTATLYEKAFGRYLPSQMPNLLKKLLPDDGRPRSQRFSDMKDSLELMEKRLVDIPYGERLEHSVAWLLRVVTHMEERDRFLEDLTPHQQWMTMARMLLWTGISPDGMHNAVSPIFQQTMHNVVDVLEVAHDEKALIAMLTDRLSPLKYQRPSTSKELKAGAIQNAINILGSFTNRVMTLDEAGKISDAIRLSGRTDDSCAAFQKMMPPSKKKNISSTHGFANRSSSTDRITTIATLLARLEKNPHQTLTIRVAGMSAAVLFETTLAEEFRCVPYFWSFLNDTSFLGRHCKNAYEEVAVIIPQEKHTTYKNTLFILRDPIRPTTISNCCFPEFLNVRHRRTCRDAFERLNKDMIPAMGDSIAMGIGVSAINSIGSLHKTLNIRLDGIDHVIYRLY